MIIDVTRLIGRTLKGYQPTGIDRVCIEYLKHFKGITKTSVYFLRNLWVFNEKLSLEIIDCITNQDKEKLKKLLVIFPLNLASTVECEIFINVSHSGGLDADGYNKILMKRKLKPVFMVHDLIPIVYPEFTRNGEDKKHEIKIKNMVLSKGLILVNSEQTKAQLIKYVKEKFNIDISNSVETNYLGISTKILNVCESDYNFMREKYDLWDKYFVVLSTIEPRKNHLILLYAWKALHKLLKQKTPQLLFIGRRGWECEQVIDFIERSSIKSYIKEINNCPDQDLKTLLRHSQALLMPSIEEGFGLPVLEAIMLDVLAICSNIPVFVELFKDIPLYASWHDASDWVNLIIEILSGKRQYYLNVQRQKLKKNFKYIAQYSWDSHFNRLREILYKHCYITQIDIIKGGNAFVYQLQH